VPELPDIDVYVDALNRKLRAQTPQSGRIDNAYSGNIDGPPESE